MGRKPKEVKEPNGTGFRAIAVFKDADKYVEKGEQAETYSSGDDVSHFDEDRIQSLISRGLVEAYGPELDPENDPAK